MKASEYYTEAHIHRTDKTNVFFDSKLRDISSGSIKALSVRVKVGNSTGAAFTTNLDKWNETLQNAISIAKSSPKHDIDFNSPSKQTYFPVKVFSDKISKMTEEDIVDLGLIALNKCEDVTVQQLMVEKVESEELFANSNGIHVNSKDTLLDSEIAVTKSNATSWDGCGSRNVPDFNRMAETVVDICKKSINPIKMKTQKMDITLGFHAINDLFSALLVPALSADYVVESKSYLKEKMNKRIASKNFTLVDDGTIDFAQGSYKFDSEGVSKSKTILIENGILKNFISDWYSGSKLMGEDFKRSTGNSESLLRRPSVSHSNFVITPEKNNVYDGKSLLIHHLVGLHTSNKVSGDFSLNCENTFLVNNGELTPVKNVMISGNIFDMLKNIRAIGKNQLTNGKIITPKIKFSKIQVIA